MKQNQKEAALPPALPRRRFAAAGLSRALCAVAVVFTPLLRAGAVAPAEIDSPDTYGTACVTIKGHPGGGGSTLTYLALQVNEPKVAEGMVTGAGAGTLTDSAAGFGTFTANQYYVVIKTTGAQAAITANTGTVITLANDISSPDPTGLEYEIRKFTTIGRLFGAMNGIGINPGANEAAADNVILISPGGATRRFFYSGAQWRDGADTTDATNEIIRPEEAVIIERKIAGDLTFYPQGTLRFTPITISIAQGFNLLSAVRTNAAITLNALNLPAAGFAGGDNPSAGDNLIVVEPDGTTFTRYFYQAPMGPWRNLAYADSGATTIPAGATFFILRRGASSFDWTLPAE